MHCPKCGHIVSENAEFCSNCGTRINKNAGIQSQTQNLPRYCPKCGQKLPANASFCPKCGEKIKQTTTQRTMENERNFSEPVRKSNIRNRNSKIPKKRSKKLIALISAIAAVALVVLISTIFINNAKEKKECQDCIENLVDVYNTVYSLKDSDNVNLDDLKKIIDGTFPKNMAGDINDVLESEVEMFAEVGDMTQEEVISELLSSDDTAGYLNNISEGPIQFEKINSVTRLKKDEMRSYEEQIHQGWTSIASETRSDESDVAGVDEDALIDKLKTALINIDSEYSSLEVTDGYTVTFTVSYDGKKEKETIDILYIDGSWVAADDMVEFEREVGKSYKEAYEKATE